MSGTANEVSGMDPKRWQLLAALARERGLDPGQLPIPVRQRGSGSSPLSYAQERLWVLDQIEPGLPVYNEPYRSRLAGRLDVAALAASLSEVTRRHEVLRSRFLNQGGLPAQVVSPAAPLPLPLLDLSALPAARRRAEADRLSREESVLPFDLVTGPVLRAGLIRLEPTEHLLLLTLHHIVCDATSIGILAAELEALYGGKVLAEPALQYADFAAWQRDCLQGKPLADLLEYWQGALRGAPPLLDLPADAPRPERLSFAGGERALRLDTGLAQGLHALARREGVTLFMLLLAAFEALLARLSGQEDILVATPVAGRGRTELEGLIGFFVNTVVLRADLSGDPGFAELVRRVRKTALGAFDHQDLPFARLVEELQPARSAAHAPLVQVAFMLQRALPATAARAAGPALALRRLDNGTAKFDLTFNLVENRSGIGGVAEYSSSLFCPATLERWLDHWLVMLEAVSERPDRRLSELPLLSPAQRAQLLAEWNDRDDGPVAELCVHELFERAVDRWPERVAVEWEGQTLTYAELEARTARLAAHLRSLGVGPETAVGLCSERSPDLVVGLLGILRAGGCYLPLDPEYPAERLAYMLSDSAVRVVVTQQKLRDRLPADVHRVELDGVWEAEAAESERALPGHLAYVIHTSGSTGRPKGTLVAHRGVVNMLRWRQRNYPIGPEDRVLQTDSFSFDASVWQFFWTLSTGARLVLTRPGGHRDSGYLVDLLASRGITVVGLVPSMLQVILQERELERCSSLRHVFCGGEALSLELVAQLCRRLPGLELHNVYGPTEATIDATDATYRGAESGQGIAPIGRPLAHQRAYVLDSAGAPAPPGVPGELHIGGVGLARGYHRQPGLTAERFVPDGVSSLSGERLYRTGDRVRWLTDGRLEFLGRFDHQVKIRGFRIELREIEAALAQHPEVTEAIVLAWNEGARGVRLVAYFVSVSGEAEPTAAQLRGFLRATLPEHMVPAAFVPLPALPLTPSGKIDRQALPSPTADHLRSTGSQAPPRTELERTLAELWKDVLGVEQVGRDDHFFDLGGHSLLLIQLQARLRAALGRDIPAVDLFRFTTIRTLAEHLQPETARPAVQALPLAGAAAAAQEGEEIAIVGMTGRFPGARNVEELWHNLRNGVESVTFYNEEELLAAGIPGEVLRHPSYVRASSSLDGYDHFDAAFFGMSPRETQALDPQHRLFLECAWEAIEIAGYDAARYPGAIGVFAGMGMNGYLLHEVSRDRGLVEALGGFQTMLGNDKDFLPTRVSYKLNLRGPSLLVQTACSTSLVAVHLACRSLLAGECDMALAGGVTIAVPHRQGYMYQDGGIFSPDGHCRAFDANAKGTVPASGVGIVVLKRLSAALADGDTIHAVIKGSAINNDGSNKIGYTAPSVTGQIDVLRKAIAASGVEADSISYIETHGTGTNLGDLVEIAALKDAYAPLTDKKGFCAIGSLKTNFGHLDTAAGVGGLIKTALALRHRELPPSLHFERPNPRLHLEGSPFFVNSRLQPWETNGTPRRAGVSSFGIGGTNAHVILEEAPALERPAEQEGADLILLSARTETALGRAAANLADHLDRHSGLPLASVASTLRLGRRPFPHRLAVVARDSATLARDLHESTPGRIFSSFVESSTDRPVAFMFPGGGAQHVGMAREIYEREPLFREHVDTCAGLLRPHLGLDLREVLYASPEKEAEASQRLRRTGLGLPALFTVEYALAQLWMGWGIRPQSLIGHSLGEYVVACLAGVLSLADALALVALRGRLFETLPPGAMLSVPLSESELRPYLGGLSIAAVNLPAHCVVSGPQERVRDLESELAGRGIESRLIQIEVAAHSELVEPILEEFGHFVTELPLNPPSIPFVSNLTGTWITDQEAIDPRYWRRHLRETVRFADGIRELLKEPERILLEVGPGRTLATLAKRHPGRASEQLVLNSLRHPEDDGGEVETLLGAVGQLWLAGGDIDWQAFQGQRPVYRVPLPPYPFERERFWANGKAAPAERVEAPRGPADWLHVTSWERVPLPPPAPVGEDGWWLLFVGDSPLSLALARGLAATGASLVTVRPGASFGWSGPGEISLRPEEPADYYALLDTLEKSGRHPARLVHAWCLESGDRSFERWQELGFESLRRLDQALAASREGERLTIDILTCEVQEVLGAEPVVPAKARVLGWCEEVPRPQPVGREYRCLDVALPAPESEEERRLAAHLVGDLARGAREPWIAYRGGRRWMRGLKRVRAEAGPAPGALREGNVFVITDGGEGLGGKIAALLSRAGAHVMNGASDDPERWPDRPRVRLSVRSLASVFDPAGLAADRAAGHLAHATALLEGERELVWDEALLDGEGAEEALCHALALPEETRVVISSRDLSAWLAARTARPEAAGDKTPATVKPPRAASNRPSSAPPYVAPGSDLEKTLVRIWEEVLGISPIGILDRFNAIGGDSVLAIQAVAKAQQHGLPVTHRMAYLNNTIADLAIAVRVDPSISAKQGVLTGPVPLIPVQKWLLEEVSPPHPHHWNIDVLLETREDTDPRLLEAVFGHLELHHDALRLRFAQSKPEWTQRYAEPAQKPFFHQIDVTSLPGELQGPALAAAAGQLQRSLNLAEGPLMRAAFFHRGSGVRGRLLIIFHHLVTDAVSLPILLEDVERWYEQLERTGTLARPAKTSSFGQWALRISDPRGLQTMEEELGYWLSPARASVTRLPVDFPDGLNTMGSMQPVALAFTPEETGALLHEAPKALDADVPTLLLTALSMVYELWSGERALLVDMEGHGREPIFDDFDFSRTAGWFTSVYPLLLDRRDAPDGRQAQVLRIREQIRAVPNRGLGYGLLRYLSPSPEVRGRLRALQSAEVIFRYLSQAQRPPSTTARFRRVGEPRGDSVCPQGIKRHLLDISAQVFDGRLHLHFWYSRNLYRGSTVEEIADAYRHALSSLLGAGQEDVKHDRG